MKRAIALFLRIFLLMEIGVVGGACSNLETTGSHPSKLVGIPLVGERTLLWASEVRLRPGGLERLAEGPSAVAAGPAGSVFILDRLHRRVLRLDGASLHTHAKVPRDTEDIAAAPDGSLALYSPVRATVQVLDPAGKELGSLKIPRVFRQIQGIEIGLSHRLSIHVALQETFLLGSPAIPQTLGAILHSRREGAFILSDRDHAGVVVKRRSDGHAELLLLSEKNGEGRHVLRDHVLKTPPVLGARIVGLVGHHACVLLEHRASEKGTSFKIHRSVRCLDLETGHELLRTTLPNVGLYLPRRELAVGDNPPRLVFTRVRVAE